MFNGATVLTKFTADTSDFDKGTKKVETSIGSIAKGNIIATGITKAFGMAWDTVTQNMDAAINRYDTIQNFPKVMKNFGVSAEDAAASVDRIADSVLGLPTSLDQAVAGVQDIFMVTKDLKKAEDMFTAINDSAMVFANGSTQAVDMFIYAYKQAMAAGKVSAQDFNQMNQAIPGVMDKVAESMGIGFAELKDGLSNGSISMDEFNNALKKLDTEGVGAMGAMRDAAFDATGGIKTALTNMNSRIAAGLAEMIDAVNKGLKEAGMGDLATIFSDIGTTIKNALVSLAPYITSLVTSLLKIGKWVIKHKTLIEAIVVPILAIISAIKIWSVVTGILSTAMGILNAVMAMNPITLIVLAIVGLIALFVLLWNKCEGFRNFWIGLWEGIKTFAKGAIDGVKGMIMGIVNIVQTVWNTIKTIFDTVINFVKNNWQGLLLMIVNPWAGGFKLLYDNCEVFRNFVDGFVAKIKAFFSNLKTAIGNAISGIINFIKSIPGKIMSIPTQIFNFFKSLPSKMLSIGLDIVKGIGKGITNGFTWIKNRIKEFVGNVTDFIKKIFKIGSPSKLMENQVGQWIPKGIAVGIDANVDSVYKSMAGMQKELSHTFQLSPQVANSSALHYSPTVISNVEVNMQQDPLGQMVRDVKTFSGGSKNDYNYGMGV